MTLRPDTDGGWMSRPVSSRRAADRGGFLRRRPKLGQPPPDSQRSGNGQLGLIWQLSDLVLDIEVQSRSKLRDRLACRSAVTHDTGMRTLFAISLTLTLCWPTLSLHKTPVLAVKTSSKAMWRIPTLTSQ